jgi:uncharacterized membrane protein (UPF0127 family)
MSRRTQNKKLVNLTKGAALADKLIIANRFVDRAVGLLGHEQLATDTVMWIHSCSSIHTFFMRFPIDVVFVDRHLKVKALFQNLSPNRLLWPVWGARSVFEGAAGTIASGNIAIGDQLHVEA